MNLSTDVFCDSTGKLWTAIIRNHPDEGGDGVIVWQKDKMSSLHNANTAMQAAWTRLHHAEAKASRP